MSIRESKTPRHAIRGPALTFKGDPFKDGLENTMVYESDAIVAFGDGHITHFGPVDKIKSQIPADLPIKNYGQDSLISPGFLDSHVHKQRTVICERYSQSRNFYKEISIRKISIMSSDDQLGGSPFIFF